MDSTQPLSCSSHQVKEDTVPATSNAATTEAADAGDDFTGWEGSIYDDMALLNDEEWDEMVMAVGTPRVRKQSLEDVIKTTLTLRPDQASAATGASASGNDEGRSDPGQSGLPQQLGSPLPSPQSQGQQRPRNLPKLQLDATIFDYKPSTEQSQSIDQLVGVSQASPAGEPSPYRHNIKLQHQRVLESLTHTYNQISSKRKTFISPRDFVNSARMQVESARGGSGGRSTDTDTTTPGSGTDTARSFSSTQSGGNNNGTPLGQLPSARHVTKQTRTHAHVHERYEGHEPAAIPVAAMDELTTAFSSTSHSYAHAQAQPPQQSPSSIGSVVPLSSPLWSQQSQQVPSLSGLNQPLNQHTFTHTHSHSHAPPAPPAQAQAQVQPQAPLAQVPYARAHANSSTDSSCSPHSQPSPLLLPATHTESIFSFPDSALKLPQATKAAIQQLQQQLQQPLAHQQTTQPLTIQASPFHSGTASVSASLDSNSTSSPVQSPHVSRTDADILGYLPTLLDPFNAGNMLELENAINYMCSDDCVLRTALTPQQQAPPPPPPTAAGGGGVPGVSGGSGVPFVDHFVPRNQILAYFKAVTESFPDATWRLQGSKIRKNKQAKTTVVVGSYLFKGTCLTSVYTSAIDDQFISTNEARKQELRGCRPEVQYVKSSGTFHLTLNKDRRVCAIDIAYVAEVFTVGVPPA